MKFLHAMQWKFNRNICIRGCLELAAIAVVYSVGCVLSNGNNLIAFLWMLAGCLGFFLYFSLSSRNLLDLRAILFASITGAVAVCQLRLSAIQVVWENETWLYQALGLAFFNIGYLLVNMTRLGQYAPAGEKREKQISKKITFGFKPKHVYHCAIFLAVMPIVLFCIQAKIKGFIPIFVQRYDAYILFYTRLSIFINLVMFSAPLAFWCLKNLELKWWQRLIMYAIIPLPTIMFQLMVQRGLFVWSICILLVMVYFQNKHKFTSVLMVVALMLFGIVFSSAMRGIPADAMKSIWQIDDNIVISSPESSKPTDVTGPSDEVTQPGGADQNQQNNAIIIKVPEFLYAPYYYVINGMENFNHMVVNIEHHSMGLRQLTPFTVILRFPALKNMISQYPKFTILPSSTNCLISDFYYDFGVLGIVVESLLLGILSAIIQYFTQKKKDLFATLEYGVFLAVLLTAFFAAWFTEFGTWLFAGTAFLIFLYCYFSKRKELNREG